MFVRQDREERGRGLRHFAYAPDVFKFAHIAAMMSPRCYKFISKFIPLPTIRTLQIKRSKELSDLPVGILPRCFALASEYLKTLSWDGPVGLACDDTKLHAAFRPHWDKDRESYVILGHAGQVLELKDPDEFEALLAQNKFVKATKVRTWSIMICLPKITAIVVAAKGITESNTGEELMPMTLDVLKGLWSMGILVCSSATDGAKPERNCGRLLAQHKTSTHDVVIHHPGLGRQDIHINIPLIDGHPLAILQDCKHLSKTSRNQLFSGARLLVFPQHVVMYSQLLDIATSGGPLFMSDVVNTDRQDDPAATRTHSGHTIAWLAENRDGRYTGLIVYLFMFGEAIDAVQNRAISHYARVVMLLRLKYFVELWKLFLEQADYPVHLYFISPDAADILDIYINGLLELIIIYRDFFPGTPLLPWKLQTEVLEHLFGVCRSIVKDFTMHDFHAIIPKAMLQLREASITKEEPDGRDRASGYSHTYNDARDINLAALRAFPTNEHLNRASTEAYTQAENAFEILGLSATALGASASHFPPITSWWTRDDDIANGLPPLEESDEEDEPSTLDLQGALEEIEDARGHVERVEEVIMEHRCAAVALAVDDHIKISSLPSLESTQLLDAWTDDAAYLSTFMNSLPAPSPLPANPPMPDSLRLGCATVQSLVNIRMENQTRQADTGVRQQVDGEWLQRGDSEKHKLERRLRDIAREHETIKRVGTGTLRKILWTEHEPTSPATGHAANAKVAASQVAKK
ncbi:hypothetical protein CYLTODRAFT_350392, partial [Cylindrobasidium torrendii FP15055 ss-10]